MHHRRSDRARLGRRLWGWVRIVGAAAILALGLSVTPLLFQQSGSGLSSVLACGLGNTPTMLANGNPALMYPVPTNVNVPADEPVGTFALNYAAGSSITFAEDFSNMVGAPAPSTLKWRWSFGDGSSASEQIAPSHTFTKAGRYAVRSQIWDSGSNAWTDFDSSWIDVSPSALANPPVARGTASATAVVQGGKITFDATGSHAVVGSHVTYEWNFNDASTASGIHVTHEFDITGKGFVALIVTDDRGARSVARIDIAVLTDPSQVPTANLTSTTSNPVTGSPVAFDASGSTPDSVGDNIVQYNWDFGDGTQTTTQSPTTTHIYAKTGTYRVAVQAVDDKGTPAQAVIGVTIGTPSPTWIPYAIGAIVALLLIAGIVWVVRGQIRQARVERERAAMMELRRAKRVPQGGVRPGDPRWGDPRTGARRRDASRTSAGRSTRRRP
jgi:PKD repeat protein